MTPTDVSRGSVRRTARRRAVRGAVPVTAGPTVVWAEQALAAPGWNGTGLTGWQMIGLFAGIPIALFVLIALLFVLIPSWVQNSRRNRE